MMAIGAPKFLKKEKTAMDIGVCITHDAENMEEKILRMKAQGFRRCQLLTSNPALWTDEEAARLRDCFQAHDAEITAFWCGLEGPAEWNFYDGPLTLGPVSYTHLTSAAASG